MTTLHVFDMDGTLLTGSACLEISRYVGQLEVVNDMEERWGRGEVGHVEFYEFLIELWAGLRATDVDEVFRATPWIKRIQDVFADIAARGERSAVISLSPHFFVERLLAWGATSAHGARVEVDEVVDPARVLTPHSKVEILDELLARYGLDEDHCVAYGDSASDIPLFDRLTRTVAINGSDQLRAVARADYQGDDLWEAYQLGRSLIDTDRSRTCDHVTAS